MSKIVNLTLKHLSDYVDFKNESAEESPYINRTTKEKAEKLILDYMGSKDKHGFILLDGEEIIGQLFLEANIKKQILHILLISVLSRYAGKGHSSELMKKAVVIAEGNNLCDIELIVHEDNSRAIAFYEKKGFSFIKNHSKHNLLYRLEISERKENKKPPIYLRW